MIGPKIEENTNSEIVLFKSNSTDTQSIPRVKRKLFTEQLDSMGNEDENACVKRRNIEENGLNIENGCLPTRLEVVVVNGKWDTSQKIPSIIAEMHSVNLQDFDVVNEFCVPWSDSSGTEISIEDDDIFKQVATFMDSDLDFSVDSRSVSGESTPLTGHSDTEYKPVNDPENNCDENLSWLINFKVGSLFNADEVEHDHNYQGREDGATTHPAAGPKQTSEIGMTTPGVKTARSTSRCGRLLLSDSNGNVRKLQPSPNQMKPNHANRYAEPRKPPFTYTELIEQALQEKGELTVSGIYQWISEHFPFYKANDDRWKNSVRHNLSINPHFRKGCKAPHGAGHLWAIANKDEHFHIGLQKKQRIQFMSNIVTIEEVEAATASIEDNKENRDLHKEMLLTINAENTEVPEPSSYTSPSLSPQEGVSLEQSAEEILSGVKKEVEVQYLIPVREKSPRQTDFLNPVSKEVVVEESGLLEKVDDIGTSYLITDLNPAALGLTMGEAEIITPDTLFAEEIGFQYYELTSPPPQLQV